MRSLYCSYYQSYRAGINGKSLTMVKPKWSRVVKLKDHYRTTIYWHKQGQNPLNNQAGGSCAMSWAIVSFLEDSASFTTSQEFPVSCLRRLWLSSCAAIASASDARSLEISRRRSSVTCPNMMHFTIGSNKWKIQIVPGWVYEAKVARASKCLETNVSLYLWTEVSLSEGVPFLFLPSRSDRN